MLLFFKPELITRNFRHGKKSAESISFAYFISSSRDPVMHMMKLYARRVEVLATKAVTARVWG